MVPVVCQVLPEIVCYCFMVSVYFRAGLNAYFPGVCFIHIHFFYSLFKSYIYSLIICFTILTSAAGFIAPLFCFSALLLFSALLFVSGNSAVHFLLYFGGVGCWFSISIFLSLHNHHYFPV